MTQQKRDRLSISMMILIALGFIVIAFSQPKHTANGQYGEPVVIHETPPIIPMPPPPTPFSPPVVVPTDVTFPELPISPLSSSSSDSGLGSLPGSAFPKQENLKGSTDFIEVRSTPGTEFQKTTPYSVDLKEGTILVGVKKPSETGMVSTPMGDVAGYGNADFMVSVTPSPSTPSAPESAIPSGRIVPLDAIAPGPSGKLGEPPVQFAPTPSATPPTPSRPDGAGIRPHLINVEDNVGGPRFEIPASSPLDEGSSLESAPLGGYKSTGAVIPSSAPSSAALQSVKERLEGSKIKVGPSPNPPSPNPPSPNPPANAADLVRIVNLDGTGQNVRVNLNRGPFANQPIVLSIAPGYELIASDHKLSARDLHPTDGFGRKNIKTIGKGNLAVCQISVESILRSSSLVASMNQKDSGAKDRRILADMSKMAAVLNQVNGSYGYQSKK